jgi:hypothetical protein
MTKKTKYYCDSCINGEGYVAGMCWPPYIPTCKLRIWPAMLNCRRQYKHLCKEWRAK